MTDWGGGGVLSTEDGSFSAITGREAELFTSLSDLVFLMARRREGQSWEKASDPSCPAVGGMGREPSTEQKKVFKNFF
jgi:hypothetical protein